MISTATTARRIIAAPAPVLLSDTCTLLDVIRDPTRDSFTGAHVDAAKRLLVQAEAQPKGLWITLTHQVLAELTEHRTNIEQAAVASIQKLEDTVRRVQAIITAHGLPVTAPDLVAAGLPPVAQLLVERFVKAALHITTPRGVQTKAWSRIAAGSAPAQKGQQAKDCMIIESYLALARELRNQGALVPIVFFSVNTRDYSDPADKSSVHPTLAAEFDALQVRYATNFGMAEHLLK